jgi:hypothetical protein
VNPIRTFAKAQVNRIWYHLMGRGLVDPVDDFRHTNPTDETNYSHTLPRRLSAEQFFDLRHSTMWGWTSFEAFTAVTRAGQIAGPLAVFAALSRCRLRHS